MNLGEEVDNYKLYSVVNHKGSLGSGHYTAQCVDDSNTWHLFNDQWSSIYSKLESQQAYLLWYRKSENKVEPPRRPDRSSKTLYQKKQENSQEPVDRNNLVDKKQEEVSQEGVRKSLRSKKVPEKLKQYDETNSTDKNKDNNINDKSLNLKADSNRLVGDKVDTLHEEESKRWCVCQRTYKEDDSTMIDCIDCPNWFHTKCVVYKCDKCFEKGQIQMQEEGELKYYKGKYEEEQLKVKETKWALN